MSCHDMVLGHAAALVERLIFWSRNLGVLPRFDSSEDPLAPLCVNDDEVSTMLAGLRRREPRAADPLAARTSESRGRLREALARDENHGFAALVRSYALDDRALDELVLVLAPDWDVRFGRLFGFLNNDLSRQRPTVAHLDLLGVRVGSPLVAVESSALPVPARSVYVPPHVVDISRAPVAAASSAARPWERLHLADADRLRLREALDRELDRPADNRRLVALEGYPGSGRRAVALAAAAAAGRGHIDLDLTAAGSTVAAAVLRGRLANAVVLVRSDGVAGAETLAELAREAERSCVVCLAFVRPGELESLGAGVRFTRIVMPRLRARERRAMWREEDVAMDAQTLDEVAGRFELGPGRIEELARELRLRRVGSAAGVARVGTTLRELTTEKLGNLATAYRGDLTLDELIVPADVRDRLDEIVMRLRHRYRVMDEWGFGTESGRGRGVTALFAGPSGTGKTAAAGAVARALDLDLFVVDLSRVMSKWVGETEQNLARVFDEAEASGAALLFDEADSLFGKRSTEMKSSSDRYANLTVNFLLQRVETFAGLAILTTNLESAIDTAFSRRLSCRVDFPKPDADERLELWRRLLPRTARYGADVTLELLVEQARRFELSGARIRSAITRAAYLAAARGAADGPCIAKDDLVRAAAMELEDMGRVLRSSTSGGKHGVVPRLVG